MLDINFTSTEEGMEKLRKYVSIRNVMGGALYWNIVNDDCLRLPMRFILQVLTEMRLNQY